MLHRLLPIFVLLFTSLTLAAPTTLPSDDPTVVEARKVTKDFFRAVLEKKEDVAQSLYVGANEKFVHQISTLASATSEFTAALTAKFPESAEQLKQSGPDAGFKSFVETVEGFAVYKDGDNVYLASEPEALYRVQLRSVDGKLKIAEMPQLVPPNVLALADPMANLIKSTITDINAGKYTSAAQVKRAFMQNSQQLLGPATRPTTLPATPPVNP